jgi:hypothetical protein
MSRRKEPTIPAELLDQLLAGSDAASALDKGGLLDSLKKALAERALNAEMDHHLGGDEQVGNSRNGYGRKRVITDSSKIEIEVPRDREGSFDPQLIAKYQRRFPGFDEKIISMNARGMSTREITGHLRALYGIDVSPDLISTVTDGEHRAVPGAREDAQRWKKLLPGSSGRLIRPIHWCFSTPFASRSAMKAWFAAKLFISRLASALMAAKRFSACGLNKMKVPNSGCAL